LRSVLTCSLAALITSEQRTVVNSHDAQSAVERELVLRLASLLWRISRASTMETGLFEIQAKHLLGLRKTREAEPGSDKIIHRLFGPSDESDNGGIDSESAQMTTTLKPPGTKNPDHCSGDLAQCFLRLTHLPTFPLDRRAATRLNFGAKRPGLFLLSKAYTAASYGSGGADCVHITERNG
jgi:hypothetical protein